MTDNTQALREALNTIAGMGPLSVRANPTRPADIARAALEAQGAPEPTLREEMLRDLDEWAEGAAAVGAEPVGEVVWEHHCKGISANAKVHDLPIGAKVYAAPGVGVPAPSSSLALTDQDIQDLAGGGIPNDLPARCKAFIAAVRGHQAQAVAGSPGEVYVDQQGRVASNPAKVRSLEEVLGHQTESDSSAVQRPADGDLLATISERLTVMLADAEEHTDSEWITGYTIKTGALHSILGLLAGAGHTVEIVRADRLARPARLVITEAGWQQAQVFGICVAGRYGSGGGEPDLQPLVDRINAAAVAESRGSPR